MPDGLNLQERVKMKELQVSKQLPVINTNFEDVKFVLDGNNQQI